MPSASELRERVSFESQTSVESDGGTVAGNWAEQFTRRAKVRYLKGSEPVIAQRLVGVSPVVVTVRSDHMTRTVDSSWRLRDSNSGTLLNIRSVTPDEKRTWIDLLCEVGSA